MTRHFKRYGLIAIVIVFLAAAILGWTQLQDPHEEQGHIEVFGNVDVRQVNLGFKIPGRLAEMKVEEGDQVAAGDVIAALARGPRKSHKLKRCWLRLKRR